MVDCMMVQTNEDGTATATVGKNSKTLPTLYEAVEWATQLLYEIEGEECG